MPKEEPKPKEKVNFKFPMHNTHLNKSLANLRVACTLALIAPLCFYFLNNLPRKQKYKNFYANYDPTESFERMMSGGYLTSCIAGGNSKKKK